MRNTPLQERRLITSNELARVLGYNNRAAFWDAVRRAGIPYIRINARRFMFDAAEVEAWLERRKVGGRK